MGKAVILLYAPTPEGGLAEHIFYQGAALQRKGAVIVCLTTRTFLRGRNLPFQPCRVLMTPPEVGVSKFRRRIWQIFAYLFNPFCLAWFVLIRRPDLVLLDSYAEYLAPVWVWPHVLLGFLTKVRYAANLHDPVRDFMVGPKWWHQLSVRLAYLPLDFVLVHDNLDNPSLVPRGVQVIQVPVGVYDLPSATKTRKDVLHEWGIPSGKRVFLAFGYVRDGKNLDLAIQALREVSDACLVIAGTVASSGNRTFDEYRKISRAAGVEDRVVFREGFVDDSDLGNYFEGADFILLTYSRSFHSQSGVLNIAVRARKLVLASAAPSPLLESVSRFDLGVAVEPDSLPEVSRGMRELLSGGLRSRWADYEAYADWEANAEGILRGLRARNPIYPA